MPSRIIDEVAESFFPDFSFADVFMSIDAAACFFLGIIGMDALYGCHADVTLHLFDHGFLAVSCSEVVAGGEQVAGIEADAEVFGCIESGDDVAELFESVADGGALSGGGFEEDGAG